MDFLTSKPIAHRGFHDDDIPENSLRAFEEAMSHGYSIELDVHLSSDGTVVVFHDESLKRMTGSKGRVNQYSLKSLKQLKLLDTDEEIPTLKEVLDFVGGRTPLIIEIKNHAFDGEIESRVATLVENYIGDYAIQSFNPLTLKWFRQNRNNVKIGLLVTGNYSDTKLGFVKQKLLKYMSFLPVVRPDYIGLDYESFNIFQYLIIKKLTFGKIIFWTIKSQEVFNECREFGDNIIFEGFHPEV